MRLGRERWRGRRGCRFIRRVAWCYTPEADFKEVDLKSFDACVPTDKVGSREIIASVTYLSVR